MSIRTKYEIFGTKKQAPIHSGYDKAMAYVTWQELLHNPQGDCYRMEQTPELTGEPTKSEEYVLLVWYVRKLIQKYYRDGRKREDLDASLEQEARLDNWNRRTTQFIQSHPGYKPSDEKSHAFYQLVNEWRKTWHERMAYRKRKMDFQQQVLDEMTKKCRALEKQIDEYVKDKLQLL